MASDEDFWYTVGYALEQVRRKAERAGGRAHGPGPRLAGLAERLRDARQSAEAPPWMDERVVAAAGTAVLGRILSIWRPRRHTGVFSILRAGVAGAGAAPLVEAARPLLSGGRTLPELDRGTLDRMLAGLGDGLVYGAVAEPRLPGPAAVKGALYGAAEFAVTPMGGLARLFGSATPQGRIPMVGKLLDDLEPRERLLLEHVVAGIAMAILYGALEDRSGIAGEFDDA